MSKKWDYDGSVRKFPMKKGELWSCPNGEVMINDLYDGLPEFMLKADCVFVDPPYNLGLENGYRTKAGIESRSSGFNGFLEKLFDGIDRIAPSKCFVEMGKQNLSLVYEMLSKRFKHVNVYTSMYYNNPKNKCYIVQGSNKPPAYDYNGVDEVDIIRFICKLEEFSCIADPCMGRGAVGFHAFLNSRQFVGTELNPSRLAVMVNKIHSLQGDWRVNGKPFQPAITGGEE